MDPNHFPTGPLPEVFPWHRVFPHSPGEVAGRILDYKAQEKTQIYKAEQEEVSLAKMTTRANTW